MREDSYRRHRCCIDLHPGRVEQRPHYILTARVRPQVEWGQLGLRGQFGRDGVRGRGGQLRFEAGGHVGQQFADGLC